MLPLLGAMRNVVYQVPDPAEERLLPLLGAMRNGVISSVAVSLPAVATPLRGDEELVEREVARGDVVLLPLLGAMRNWSVERIDSEQTALLPLLGAMRN